MTASLALTVFAEVLCSFLLIIGLGTRLATIPLIIMMLTIIFVVHWNDPFSKTEFALLFMVPYVCILLMGAGRISIDALLSQSVSR
jgi:putative oxidoreductase